MTEHNSHDKFPYNLEKSAIVTFLGIVLLFSGAVIVTLIAPALVDPTWTTPTSDYQVQMYEIADPNVYISSSQKGGGELQYVYHIQKGFTLLAFHESDTTKIVAPPELEKFITKENEQNLKLTSNLLLLRRPQASEEGNNNSNGFDAQKKAEEIRSQLQSAWEKEHPDWKEKQIPKPDFDIFELYAPQEETSFAQAPGEGFLENWVDKDYTIIDEKKQQSWHNETGVIYINNPREYRISFFKFAEQEGWKYDPNGYKIKDLRGLRSHPLGFRSRQELIKLGEHIFAVEGCWYCHTDQTRTLVQDVVLNGSESFPAPPSSANEYIYQKITFPGTRRIGPDLSRVGIKRPNRDWHKSHFWSPKTASKGSIMPAFQHFFDFDPRGTSKATTGIPNYKFEAVFQYLMTKGTRITPPTQAWWLGLDPIQTIEIIEGRKKVP